MSKHSKKALKLNSKALISLIVAIILLVSTVLCVPSIFSLAEGEGVPSIEIKSGVAWSTVQYYNDFNNGGKRLVASAYYKLVFDYKVLSGTPTFSFGGITTSSIGKGNKSTYTAVSGLTSFYEESDIVNNGICQKVIKFRVNSGTKVNNIDMFRIIIGVNDELTDTSCIFANPTLYRYSNSTYSTVLTTDSANYLSGISSSTVYDVIVNDPKNKSNKNNVWNLRYLTGKQSSIVVDSLDADTYKAKFAPPEYMLNFYKGSKNVIAVYEDNDNTAFGEAGTLNLDLNYKVLSGSPSLKVQSQNSTSIGTWNDVTFASDNTQDCKRSITFNVDSTCNGIRIITGNDSENTDVAFSISDVKLTASGSDDNLINTIHTSTVTNKGLTDANDNKKWNIVSNENNKLGAGVVVVPDDYFVAELESLMYTDVLGTSYARTEYRDASFAIQASKTYIFTSKIKVLEGEFNSSDIGVSNDPIVSLFLKGDFYVSGKIRVNSSATSLDLYEAEYDEKSCSLTIKFSTKEDMSGFYVYFGSMVESSSASISFAYPSLVEQLASNSEVTIFSNNLINDLNANTYVHMKNAKNQTNDKKEKFWNMRTAGTNSDYKLETADPSYFIPTNAYIKTVKGSQNTYISYTDSDVSFEAGKRYKFAINYRVYSGKPSFDFMLKADGSNFETISESSSFLSYFNEEYDDVNYLKTITFEPNMNITGFKFLTGNKTDAKNVSVAIANPSMSAVNYKGISIGPELIASLIKLTVRNNSGEEEVWDVTSPNADDYASAIPIPTDMFAAPVLVKVNSNVNWNAIHYSDTSLKLKAGKTYRFGIDYEAIKGSPTFLVCTDIGSRKNISKVSTSYKEYFDSDTSIRYVEFTLEADQNGIGLVLGNFTDSTSVSVCFANPTLYEVDSKGRNTGSNMLINMTDASCYDVMGKDPTNRSNKTKLWNFRYSGSFSNCFSIKPLESNYFRGPALGINETSGNITQFVTVKPNTKYAVLYKNKEKAKEASLFLNYYTNSSEGSITNFSYTEKNTDGYYNRRYEFTTPSGLRTKDNLRIGLSFDADVNSVFTDFELYELTSGFEKTGSNLIHNSTFDSSEEIAIYDGNPVNAWVYEGTGEMPELTERSAKCFTALNKQMLTFMGKTAYNNKTGEISLSPGKISKTASLTSGKTYDFSINLKYANIGNAGETGLKLYYNDGSTWKDLGAQIDESSTEYKYTATFVMPSTTEIENFKFEVLSGSGYVSGYLANATLTEQGTNVNLIDNGEMYYGSIGWDFSGDFNITLTSEIPNNFFSKVTRNTPSMIVYRNTASWVRFNQSLTLKPNTYYKLVANGVHPWQQNDELISEIAMQTFTADYKDGSVAKSDKFMGVVKGNPNMVSGTKNNVTTKFYLTPSNLVPNENISVYLYMEGIESAGYWGDMALYECDENGELLSGNIILNSDFSLGETAWTHTGDFVYRIVEQPTDFFKTYKKNDDTMIISNGSEKNAELGQWLEVKRGTKYYFSCFYIGMNGAGISPKVMYYNQAGQYVEANLTVSEYDSSRFFYEGQFELPDDINSVRGVAKAKFVVNNNNGGKGYVTGLMVCEEGKYINLYNNPKFANGFNSWMGNNNSAPYKGKNYTLVKYDDSVFTFYYDDSMFDDGDWSGTRKNSGTDEDDDTYTDTSINTGRITGSVVDGEDNPIEGLSIVLGDNEKTVKTDKDGVFNFYDVEPGDYTISIVGPNGSLVVAIEDVPVMAGRITSISKLVYRSIADALKNGSKSLKNKYYGVVCGYLFDADGAPLKGQKLYLGDVAKTTTKAKGVFQFNDVLPGKYDIYTKLSDGSICILKRVEVVAGKGAIYKIKLPSDESNNLALILIISGCAVLLLGGAAVAFVFIIKTKKGKRV